MLSLSHTRRKLCRLLCSIAWPNWWMFWRWITSFMSQIMFLVYWYCTCSIYVFIWSVLWEVKFKDAKGAIRSHNSKDRQCNDQTKDKRRKDKQWYTEHYTENKRLHKKNHTKTVMIIVRLFYFIFYFALSILLRFTASDYLDILKLSCCQNNNWI